MGTTYVTHTGYDMRISRLISARIWIAVGLVSFAMVASAIGASARTAMPADTKTATADPGTLLPTAPTDKSPWANFELGRNFALGIGVAKDVQKARTYYEQALTSADPAVAKASAFALGQLAEKELKDPATASGYFQKGADLGDEWSILSLAKLYADGSGVTKNVRQAQALYAKLLDSTTPAAVKAADFALGQLALNELNNPKLAASYFERGAKLDDAWAMFALAQISASGKKAELYERAAKTDPAVAKYALFELGQLYLTPSSRNGGMALEYHTQAAQLGNVWSWYVIARMYADGNGVKRSAIKAKRYYLLGLEAGKIEVARASAFALGDLHLNQPLRDPKLAAQYFAQGAKLGDDWSKFKLADMYASGEGVPKNASKAKNLFLELRARKDRSVATAALFALGRLHMKGPLKDYRLARQYFREGSNQGDLWSTYFLAEIYANGEGVKADRRRARALLERLRHSDDQQAHLAAESLLKKIDRG